MLRIRKPPTDSLLELLAKSPSSLKEIEHVDLSAVIQTANDRYLHWDKFRWRPLPEGLTHEIVWAYLRFQRNLNQRRVAILTDLEGQPFSYWLPDSVLRTLNQIDRWSGEMIGTDQPDALPQRERYVISSLMDEAIASSQLEGAATTRQMAKDMLRSGRKPRNHNEQMIHNNWLTIQYLRSQAKQPLTLELLCEVHAMITDQTLKDPADAGRIRTRDDIVVKYRDEVIHVPPPAGAIQDRIEAFCTFANNDNERHRIHPVVKASILHFWLAYDHPFVDGNGRTARALFYWYLLSRNYWLFEYLSISRYFLRAPSQYARAYLYTETDNRDLTYFIFYNLRATHSAFHDLHLYLQRKQRELTDAGELLRKYRGLNDRQRSIVAYALRHPDVEYTIQKHKNVNNIAYDTARNDLLELVERGLLNKEVRGKTFVFIVSHKIISHLQR